MISNIATGSYHMTNLYKCSQMDTSLWDVENQQVFPRRLLCIVKFMWYITYTNSSSISPHAPVLLVPVKACTLWRQQAQVLHPALSLSFSVVLLHVDSVILEEDRRGEERAGDLLTVQAFTFNLSRSDQYLISPYNVNKLSSRWENRRLLSRKCCTKQRFEYLLWLPTE